MKRILIIHFLNYEFVYIFLLSSIIFLFLSIFIKQKIIKKLSLVIFSVFFAFSILEYSLSFTNGKFMPLDYFGTFNKIERNKISSFEEIGFLSQNKFKWIYFADNRKNNVDLKDKKILYDVKYSVYNNGFIYTKSNNLSDKTYIFLGCSFTFGEGLNDNETLPFYFSRIYNFEKNVINCGVKAKSINTALGILDNGVFLPLMNKNSKIECFFYSLIKDQIYRNFRAYNPSDIKNYNGKTWNINKQPYGLIKSLFARSRIFIKLILPVIDDINKEYYEDYMIKSLKEMNKIIEEKYNSKLTVIVWPDDYGERFIKELKETKLDLIFLPEYFNSEEKGYKIKYDKHPTAKANEEIAKMLYNHINGLK